MEISLPPIRRNQKLSIQVADRIEYLILDGKIRPEQRIPTERILGDTFQVSRTVVREAIRILEARGLLVSKAGSGTYVRALQEKDVSHSLGLYISTQQGQNFSLKSLIEVRQVLEIQIAGFAAERATNQDVIKLKSILDLMCESKKDARAFAKWDLQFHLQIAKASGNSLFGILIEPLTEALLELIWAGSISPGAVDEACQFHQDIFTSIKNRDVEGAKISMHNHLIQSQRVAILGLEQRQLGDE